MPHPTKSTTAAETAKPPTNASPPLPTVAAAAAAPEQKDLPAADTEEAAKEREYTPLCLEHAAPDAVPLHLREMCTQHSQRKLPAAELLVLLIYLVALECGFVEEQTYAETRDQLKPAFASFHIYNVRLLSRLPVRYIKEFEDTAFRMSLRMVLNPQSLEEASEETAVQSRFMAVIVGDLLVVTLSPVPPSKERGFSVCLSIARFVLNVQLQPLYRRFCKLDELSFELRQKIFQPMRAQQLLAIKMNPNPSLLGLPSVVYDGILKYLTDKQLNVLVNVNWQLCNYIKEFKDRGPKSSNSLKTLKSVEQSGNDYYT